MVSPRANHTIDIIGSVIPAAEGSSTYTAFLKLKECHGKTYQAFRDLAGGSKGALSRTFSPSAIIKRAEAANFARLIPDGIVVPAKRVKVTESQANNVAGRWSDDELRAAFSAYLEILGLELVGEQTNKAEVNRRLRGGPLKGRTGSSVEFRMQNISAFLISKGLVRVRGYKPAKNVGEKVMARLDAIWSEMPDVNAYMPTHDAEALMLRAKQLLAKKDIVIPVGVKKPKSFRGTTKFIERSPAVVAYTLNAANGTCEACSAPAPFSAADGSRFLEVHHVTPLSVGGPDTVDNVVAVCPNCHRAFHHSVDRDDRTSMIIDKVSRLQDYRSNK